MATDGDGRRARRQFSLRARAIGACLLLAFAPVAAMGRSYSGAAALVACSGWVLVDERPVHWSLRSTSRHVLVGKLLVATGTVAFAVSFTYLFIFADID